MDDWPFDVNVSMEQCVATDGADAHQHSLAPNVPHGPHLSEYETRFGPTWALDLGKAAEHLVCCDLILGGFRAYLSDQGLPYDVIIDDAGKLLRVQVKATYASKNTASKKRSPIIGYNFAVRRRGASGARRLTEEHCDLVALVALDIRVIAYFAQFEVGQTCSLYPPGHVTKGRLVRRRQGNIDQYPAGEAIKRFIAGEAAWQEATSNSYRDDGWLEFQGKRMTLPQWSKEYGISTEVLEKRLASGWAVEDALCTEPSFHNRNPSTKISYNGQSKLLTQWARDYDLTQSALWGRLKRGWSVHEALNTPLGSRRSGGQRELAI